MLSSVAMKVREHLRKAFGLSTRSDLRLMTHDQAVATRSELIALDPTVLTLRLGEVLDDLILTHTGRAGDSEYAEDVVLFLDLDPNDASEAACHDISDPIFSEQMRREERRICAIISNNLSQLTSEQAAAIADWLLLAMEWEDMRWYRPRIVSAHEYWSKRARMHV